MIYKVLSLHYLHPFPPLAAVSPLGQLWKLLLFSLRLDGCVVVPVHSQKRKLAVFFPPSVTPLSIMLWSRAVMYPNQSTIAKMYHDQNQFDFSQGHCDQKSTNGSPFLVEWKFRNITRGLVTVLEAILVSRQPCEKLQCLYESLMSNTVKIRK